MPVFKKSASLRAERRRKSLVYHDPVRQDGPRVLEPIRKIDPDAPVVDDSEKPGFITWLFMAALIFFLYDGFMLDGYWRRETFRAIDSEAGKVRYWSDHIWGDGPSN
ncbi:hypothetical protein [Sphingomonas immobilis]|uniref:Uncharacterized protein n=1 Tax=Sphingomonas immobilis TaxID=3063997 RepID=A0ABT9A3Z6_9SPHN|nr:hypothetical protein [Sphingomonas sp. CA1-15]MDO7844568.1 hypothetical protein [Sphingomonas sp. CA1-15]